MGKHQIRLALQLKRSQAERRGRPLRLRRPPRQLYPAPAEREYRRDLLELVNFLAELVKTRLIPRLPGLAQAYAHGLPSRRKDSDDDPEDVFADMELEFTRRYTKDELRQIALRSGTKVSEWNKRQILGQIGAVLDINVMADEPWLEKVMKNYARDNVLLIESIEKRYMKEVRGIVYDGFRDGTPWEQLADEIQDRAGVSESRAELIARDQVGKLSGQLTSERQQDLGIQRFIWRTAQDERVRESHAELEGEEFAWDDLPDVDDEKGVYPGEPIQCRCWAEPVIDSVES